MSMRRRLVTIIAAGLALASQANPAAAQAFPVKPVRMIIGLSAGGTTDLVGRLLAQRNCALRQGDQGRGHQAGVVLIA